MTTQTQALSFNAIYTAAIDVSSLESPDTITYFRNVRKNTKGEVTSEGIKVVFSQAPAWIKAPEPLTGSLATVYERGAQVLFRNMVEKYIKDNSTATTIPNSQISLAALETYLASSGTKLLSKTSITDEFNNNIAIAINNYAEEAGLLHNLENMLTAYHAFYIQLASPNHKPNPDAVPKLVKILELSKQSPVVLAMLARLSKKEEVSEEDLMAAL